MRSDTPSYCILVRPKHVCPKKHVTAASAIGEGSSRHWRETIHVFFFLAFSNFLIAAAPESVSGRILRTDIAIVTLRSTSESTILLKEGGTYSFLRYATGSVLIEAGSTFLNDPPPDGAYRYRRTGERTAEIELTDPTGSLPSGGTMLMIKLHFTSSTSGTVLGYTGLNLDQAGRFQFTLTKEAASQRAPVLNVALRGRVSAAQSLIAGFVVPGIEQREVLVRVVGPSLSQFGITDSWADPNFRIYKDGSPAGQLQILYEDWSVAPAPSSHRSPTIGFRRLFTYSGAFPLLESSKDAAAVFRLTPGAYTVIAAPQTSDVGGEVLIEIYFLP